MSDYIDRQAAIDAYGDWYVEEGTEEGFIGTVKQLLEGLPSAQPATSCSEIPNGSDDTISRQAAIGICTSAIDLWNGQLGEGALVAVRDKIAELPSAQPEIVRCKNCKYWIPYDWMFSEVWQSRNIADYPENEIGCTFCDMAMKADDFCSRGERREVTT